VSLLAAIWASVAGLLDRAGVIDEGRLRDVFDLSWPRIVTGFAIMSKRTVDLAVVGIAVGTDAVAGITVANGFWTVGKFVFIGLAGGTLTLVSQNYGGDERNRATAVVQLSLLAAVVLAVPIALLYNRASVSLVGLIDGGADATTYGATYLAILAPGLLFEAVNLVASRTYAAVGNTTTPMAIRATGAVLNIALSATFVFAADLGVYGAGLGTTVATLLVTCIFVWGLTGRSYAGRGASPLPILSRVAIGRTLPQQLLSVSVPLVARRTAQGLVVFPLLAIAATFGPVVLAALGVARQIRQLLNSFTWGFSIAVSTLVGQALGAGKETLATAYSREVTTLSLLVYLLAGGVVLLAARPIAAVFVEPTAVARTVPFVAAAAVSSVPLGVDGSITGTLRGAGDTRVPFAATLIGLYLVALPVAFLGTRLAVGASLLLLALVAETTVPALINLRRVRSGRWLEVSRAYRPSADE
jgi:putative MATE family efflux protein